MAANPWDSLASALKQAIDDTEAEDFGPDELDDSQAFFADKAAEAIYNHVAGITSVLGMPQPFFGSEAQVPTDWALCDGSTVGSAASGADHASDDYEAIFDILKNCAPNAGTEDFGNDDTVTIPDLRGRVIAGKDDMGGGSANRVTDAQADVLGGTMGAETHQLTEAEMPSHNHGIPTSNNPGGTNRAHKGASTFAYNYNSRDTGGDAAHNNMQPTMFLNYIVRLK